MTEVELAKMEEEDEKRRSEPIPLARAVWAGLLNWYYRLLYLLRGDDSLAFRVRVFLRPREWMGEDWFMAWGQGRKFE